MRCIWKYILGGKVVSLSPSSRGGGVDDEVSDVGAVQRHVFKSLC